MKFSFGLQLLIVSAFLISDGLQAVVLGFFRGLQDVNIPAVITFVMYCLGHHLLLFGNTPLGQQELIGLLGLTASAILLLLRFQHLSKTNLTINHLWKTYHNF